MNINFTDLEKLIKIAESADIQSLEVTDGDARISIICQANGNTPHSKLLIQNHTHQPPTITLLIVPVQTTALGMKR